MPMSPDRAQNLVPILRVIADAGAALLASGAEVARVEDTMRRLAAAYELKSVEAIALPTALFLHADGVHTVIRRIRRRSVNLAVVAAINQLSRDVSRDPVGLEELEGRLREAQNTSRYNRRANLLFAGVAAAALSRLMGGHLPDVLPAFVDGALTQAMLQWCRELGLASGVGDLLAAMVAVLPAVIAASLGITHPGSVLVGGIMVLTPGLLMTTAVRDGIQGDVLSAAARILEALLSAGAIAAGATLPLYIYLALGGRWV